ncbi:hypothetical protein GIB67_015097 [Kingdonia uniflora]|uniref:Uncharacterized protein n=1 Tax=Kingdonia uniflora TaxID=39325 RepID=A0A7J7LIW1_9MAGN|nr:hypothetical protein GIB67_015097 [Kingdonia uniflora]
MLNYKVKIFKWGWLIKPCKVVEACRFVGGAVQELGPAQLYFLHYLHLSEAGSDISRGQPLSSDKHQYKILIPGRLYLVGKGLSTTKAGGPLRHNSFPDPEPEYRGYPKTNGRGVDPCRFGPLVDDDDVPQLNDSLETICTDIPPSNESSIPQSNVHHSNEHMLTNVPQSNKSFQTIPTDVHFSNKPKLTNVSLSIEPEPIIGQTEPSDSETTESWTYIIEMFGSNFHGYDTRFVVISDRNVRIINVVPKIRIGLYKSCRELE